MIVDVEQFLWTGLLVDGSHLVMNAFGDVDSSRWQA